MKAVYKRRLLKFAALLRKEARRKKGVQFDMRTFGLATKPERIMSCGTSACAIGLAAISGEFKRAGLGYELSACSWANGQDIYITYKGYFGAIDAAIAVFGLSHDVARDLFLNTPGEGPEGARAVAKKIVSAAKGAYVMTHDE